MTETDAVTAWAARKPLVAAASPTIEIHGYERLSLAATARAAGIPPPLAIAAVGDEPGLACAVRETARGRVFAAMAGAESVGYLDPFETIRHAVSELGELMEEDQVVRASVRLELDWTPGAPGPRPDRIRPWEAFLCRSFVSAVEIGLVPATLGPMAAAHFVADRCFDVSDHVDEVGSLDGVATFLSRRTDMVLGAWQVATRIC